MALDLVSWRVRGVPIRFGPRRAERADYRNAEHNADESPHARNRAGRIATVDTVRGSGVNALDAEGQPPEVGCSNRRVEARIAVRRIATDRSRLCGKNGYTTTNDE